MNIAEMPKTARRMHNQCLSNADFNSIRSLVYDQCGINLNADKKTMLEIRIRRRLRQLDIASFGDYCKYALGPEGLDHELVHLIDVVTTNKTDFFRESGLLRVVPELRARVEFRRLNFMDSDYGLTEAPEIIFCRNVIIYFDRPTQIRILQKLTRLLARGGYFFSGHSESLQGMDLPLVPAGPSVYKKKD